MVNFFVKAIVHSVNNNISTNFGYKEHIITIIHPDKSRTHYSKKQDSWEK